MRFTRNACTSALMTYFEDEGIGRTMMSIVTSLGSVSPGGSPDVPAAYRLVQEEVFGLLERQMEHFEEDEDEPAGESAAREKPAFSNRFVNPPDRLCAAPATRRLVTPKARRTQVAETLSEGVLLWGPQRKVTLPFVKTLGQLRGLESLGRMLEDTESWNGLRSLTGRYDAIAGTAAGPFPIVLALPHRGGVTKFVICVVAVGTASHGLLIPDEIFYTLPDDDFLVGLGAATLLPKRPGPASEQPVVEAQNETRL